MAPKNSELWNIKLYHSDTLWFIWSSESTILNTLSYLFKWPNRRCPLSNSLLQCIMGHEIGFPDTCFWPPLRDELLPQLSVPVLSPAISEYKLNYYFRYLFFQLVIKIMTKQYTLWCTSNWMILLKHKYLQPYL